MFHISTLVCDVLRTSVCVAEMWRHVLVRAVAVVEHLEIQHSCATSFPLREGTRRVGGGRCWKNMPEAVIVSIVNVMRHQPLLCCCKVKESIQITRCALWVAHRVTTSSQIVTTRPRPGEVGAARRRVAHGYWLHLISLLLHVDK